MLHLKSLYFIMADILNIIDEPIFDDRIVKIDTHTYNPYANTTFGHSDKIRISIAFVAVRKFSLHRRKIDGEEKKRRRRRLEIIGWRPCLMKFDINLTVWLTATETLELCWIIKVH